VNSDKRRWLDQRITNHDGEMFDRRSIAAKGNHPAVGRVGQRHMGGNNLP
jgi:hypothetical protein